MDSLVKQLLIIGINTLVLFLLLFLIHRKRKKQIEEDELNGNSARNGNTKENKESTQKGQESGEWSDDYMAWESQYNEESGEHTSRGFEVPQQVLDRQKQDNLEKIGEEVQDFKLNAEDRAELSLNINNSKIKLKQAVGGIFCYMLQMQGVIGSNKSGIENRRNVLSCRKMVTKNFASADTASQCISFMQTLAVKGMVDVRPYFDMANSILDIQKKQKLVGSMLEWYNRRLNDYEWTNFVTIMTGLGFSEQLIKAYEQNYKYNG